MQKWQNECIRQANIVFNYCVDSRYLNSAHKWMVVLYRDIENYVKMLEHAKKMTVFDPYEEGGDWLALAYELLGRKEDSRKQNAENIYKALKYLQSQLQIVGFSYEEEGKFEEAYDCYRLFPEFYDIIAKNRNGEMPLFTSLYHEKCAIQCMKLKRPDEAMDWLEKMAAHLGIVAKNYNAITETTLPYLYGQQNRYSSNSYCRVGTILPTLALKIFDSIRQTKRFQAILSNAEAFEKGE